MDHQSEQTLRHRPVTFAISPPLVQHKFYRSDGWKGLALIDAGILKSGHNRELYAGETGNSALLHAT